MKNQPNVYLVFHPCACFWPLYTFLLSSVRFGSEWVNYVVIKYNKIAVT